MKKKKKTQPAALQGSSRGNTGQGRPIGIDKALELALNHHRTGDLETAAGIYRQVLHHQPGNPAALHFLGVVALQRKRHAEAAELINREVALKPDYADAHSNLGNAFREMGRLEDAEASYRKAIAVNPGFAMAHY
ncbi:MAG: tetratricopeptide repeat protein, partial [Geobacteraceae bacterium]|nr:tetratricopeptide repeat protein [Geobacteraceae bacterium]